MQFGWEYYRLASCWGGLKFNQDSQLLFPVCIGVVYHVLLAHKFFLYGET